MTHRSICWGAIATVVALVGTARVQAQKTDSTALYHALLAKIQAGDTLIDFTALRYTYAASNEFQPMNFPPAGVRESVFAALDAHHPERARAGADSLVALDPVGVEPRVIRATVRRENGDLAGSAIDAAIARGLVRSVLASGDGTQQHPWVVITVSEEYAVLMAKGLRRTTQALDKCGGRPCDALEVEDPPPGTPLRYYFDVSISMNAMSRALKK